MVMKFWKVCRRKMWGCKTTFRDFCTSSGAIGNRSSCMTRPFGYNCLSRRTAAIYSSSRLSRICDTVRKNGQRSYVSRRSLVRKRSLPEQNEKSQQERARPQVPLVARKLQVLPEAVKTSGPLKSRARQNIIPFRAQLGVIRGRTEQLVATLQERTALWNSIQQLSLIHI